jgi:hypothetical protein
MESTYQVPLARLTPKQLVTKLKRDKAPMDVDTGKSQFTRSHIENRIDTLFCFPDCIDIDETANSVNQQRRIGTNQKKKEENHAFTETIPY